MIKTRVTIMRRTVIVINIVDGDTFWINKTIKNTRLVRIANYDSPEKGEPGYEKESGKLYNLLINKKVVLDIKKKDRYNRLVADIYINDKSLAKMLNKMRQRRQL